MTYLAVGDNMVSPNLEGSISSDLSIEESSTRRIPGRSHRTPPWFWQCCQVCHYFGICRVWLEVRLEDLDEGQGASNHFGWHQLPSFLRTTYQRRSWSGYRDLSAFGRDLLWTLKLWVREVLCHISSIEDDLETNLRLVLGGLQSPSIFRDVVGLQFIGGKSINQP